MSVTGLRKKVANGLTCFFLLWPVALSADPVAHSGTVPTVHGLSLVGDLKYPAKFPHFDYVNLKAPVGGKVTIGSVGGFDTFNSFNGKGEEAPALSLIYDTLMTSSLDEPSSLYGLLASGVRVAPDQSWVEFDLRPEAKWSDGKPVIAEDVVFTFNTLMEKGSPFFKAYYASVQDVQIVKPSTVRFTIKSAGNKEIASILGGLIIIPQHFWKDKSFETAYTSPPVGSGAYAVESFAMNRQVVYKKRPDYWGKDLAVNKGSYNIERIVYEVYKDQQVSFEGFKTGKQDFWLETSAKNWANEYNFDAVKQGKVKTEIFPNKHPSGYQAYIFNVRRPTFQNRLFRQALMSTMDFEWMNQNLFFGQYKRSESYFQGSEMAATELPNAQELDLLEPFRDKLPPEVFTTVYHAPSEKDGSLRERLKTSQTLLKQAGFTIDKGILKDPEGQPVKIEFLLIDSRFERITLPVIEQMKRLGIEATIRVVDSSQYTRRLENFDYDIIIGSYSPAVSPGNEQREYWSSAFADKPSSKNYIGLKDPVVDALVEKIVLAPTRQDLVIATRALDRVLQWGYYTIPQWNFSGFRVAFWNHLGYPDPQLTPYSLGFPSTWWVNNR